MLMVVIDPHFNLFVRGFNQKEKCLCDPARVISVEKFNQELTMGFYDETCVSACVSVVTCAPLTRIVTNGLGGLPRQLRGLMCAD